MFGWLCDQLWPAKAMYTIYNAGQAAAINFLPIFYQNAAHFSKWEIGILQALPCVCAVVAPPLWGALADKLRRQRLVHIFCLVTGAFLMYSLKYFSGFYMMCFMVILANFQTSPNGSLLDQSVMNLLDRVGGEYGKQRLFGAVGYGAGAYVTGLMVATAGISYAFNFHLLFSLLSLSVLRLIPAHHHEDDHHIDFSSGLKMVMRKADVMVLFLVVFLMGLMFGVLSSFLTLNLYNLSGNDAQIVGIAILCETLSELPAFFFSHTIIQRLGIVKVLLLAIGGYALRITYYSMMSNAWSALPFEFLHGVTFGLAWAACTQYIYSSAPKGTEGTMMGLLNAVQNGLGRGAGTIIGGYLYGSYGARVMWQVTDLGVPCALVGVALFATLMKKNVEIDLEAAEEEAQMLTPAGINMLQLHHHHEEEAGGICMQQLHHHQEKAYGTLN